jgi:hypothetical protein
MALRVVIIIDLIVERLMTQRLALFALAIMAGMSFFGCEADCVYPDLQTFRLRLLNAMPDQNKITVFINGKRFKHDYTYAPPLDFGYISTYEDGTLLPLGDSIFIVVTKDAAGIDTLHKGFISPNLHRQTLIIMGRGKKLLADDTSSTKHILIDDQDVSEDNSVVKIRMVHAIPDLAPIDIFFKGIPTDGSPLGTPDLTLNFGQASQRITISTLLGLTVTEAGNPDNVIFSVATPFGGKGFFTTAVVRGSAEPCDSEPVPAPILLSDNEIGNFILDFQVFGARFVNATKGTILSLTATNPPPQAPEPRNSIPGQKGKVLDIPPDSASEYFGVGVAALGNTRWFFSRSSPGDTVFGTNLKAVSNERWTFVAFQNPDDSFNGLKLKDTMECVAEAFGKVRVVNLSPEVGPVTVQITGATPMSLPQGELGFATLPAGVKQVIISSGSLTQTHSVILPGARPISIYILPSKAGQSFPITISAD